MCKKISITKLSRIMPRDYDVEVKDGYFDCPNCKEKVSKEKNSLGCMVCPKCNNEYSEKIILKL